MTPIINHLHGLRTGDRITFRAVCREGAPTVTRTVNGFLFDRPTVRYRGYRDFMVRYAEIERIERPEIEGDL